VQDDTRTLIIINDDNLNTETNVIWDLLSQHTKQKNMKSKTSRLSKKYYIDIYMCKMTKVDRNTI
jgi:hypothetical protein